MKTEAGITDERELLAACQSGDADAFRRLFDELVLHLAVRLCGDIEKAEEITQEVFLKVYHEIGTFK